MQVLKVTTKVEGRITNKESLCLLEAPFPYRSNKVGIQDCVLIYLRSSNFTSTLDPTVLGTNATSE